MYTLQVCIIINVFSVYHESQLTFYSVDVAITNQNLHHVAIITHNHRFTFWLRITIHVFMLRLQNHNCWFTFMLRFRFPIHVYSVFTIYNVAITNQSLQFNRLYVAITNHNWLLYDVLTDYSHLTSLRLRCDYESILRRSRCEYKTRFTSLHRWRDYESKLDDFSFLYFSITDQNGQLFFLFCDYGPRLKSLYFMWRSRRKWVCLFFTFMPQFTTYMSKMNKYLPL